MGHKINNTTKNSKFCAIPINLCLLYLASFTTTIAAKEIHYPTQYRFYSHNPPYDNGPSQKYYHDLARFGFQQEGSRLESFVSMQNALCHYITQSFGIRKSRFQCSRLWPRRQKMPTKREFRARTTNRGANNVFRQMVEQEGDAIELLKQEILRGLRSRIESSDALAQEELSVAKERGETLTKYVGPKGTTLHFNRDEQPDVEQNDAPEPLEDYNLLQHVDE